jgi:molybdopterin/thiamine biosynthesis adenylyltransferase
MQILRSPHNTTQNFQYEEAFSRNLGWITPQEQQILRQKRIAIAGLGGVGGNYLISLARLGFSHFNVADLDTFDLGNFNRQYGANIRTIGKAKTDVMSSYAHNINPNAQIDVFGDGLSEKNFEGFLQNSDIYLDGLDLFATPLKQKIFKFCYQQKIPIISTAPIGMAASQIAFHPEKMSPQQYFGFKPEDTIEQQIVRFLVGINPRMNSMRNLVYKEGLDIKNKRLPSLALGIELASVLTCSTAVKILLNRGKVVYAPTTLHYDVYTNLQYTSWRPFGHVNPLLKFTTSLAMSKLL